MSDLADDAAEVTEMNLKISMQNARSNSSQKKFTGFCRNCEDNIITGGFCDQDCRDDYQKREHLKR